MSNETVGASAVAGAPIFIVGLPRSGSTLWANIMYQHPDVSVFPEMHFLNPWNRDFRYLLRQIGNLNRDENVIRLVEAIFAEPSPKGIRRGPYFWRDYRLMKERGLQDSLRERLLASRHRQIGDVFRAIVEEATICRAKKRAFIQFPVYPIYVNRLAEWWPEARIMHISRNPCAIAASKSNDPGGTGQLIRRYPWMRSMLRYAGMAFATLQYVIASRAHSRVKFHDNYCVFFYEQLLREPENTLKEVCRFCQLEYAPAMLQPREGQASSISGLRSSGFDASRAQGWRDVLAPWQSRVIRRITAASMRRYGFVPDPDD